jgi:ribonuclease G
MAKRLLVLTAGELVLSFLIDGDKPYRVSAEKAGSPVLLDSIFKGKVKRAAKGMEGVFVDIGLERDAFLPLKGESYRTGESVIVQMVREPEGDKGAKLSSNIKLVGKHLIYFPKGRDVKCSSKVEQEHKERLCSIFEGELSEDGLIIRSSALKASVEELKEELNKLRDLWKRVERRFKLVKKPQILLEEYPAYIRLIRDYWSDMEEVVCDNPLIWHRITTFLEEFEPNLIKRTFYLKDPSPYIRRFSVYETIRSLFSKVVWLKGGGFIVIEETEAFTVIDVNSGDPVGTCHEENALKTNLEAVGEIVKHIMLRDIGGVILIDFIDMKKQDNRNLIINTMLSAFGEEACNVNVYGFTKLGILEMVRKKRGSSIVKLLSESCPTCKGKGYVKSGQLFMFELEKELSEHMHKSLTLEINPLRSNLAKGLLEKLGYKNVQVRETQEKNIDSYNISYA